MTDTHKLELTVPISEEDLLTFLLSRYPEEQLLRLGIGPSNCIIRDVRIEHDVEAGKCRCNFRVAALTIVNTEVVLGEAEAAQKRVIDLIEARETALKKELEETGVLAESSEGPTLPEGVQGGCAKQQILDHQNAMRVRRQKKTSNS